MLRSEAEAIFMKRLDLQKHYFNSIEQSLLPGVDRSLFWDELARGNGSEMKGESPKFCSVGSSSALAVNSFAPWKRQLNKLPLAGYSGFDTLRFEAKLQTGLRGGMPNLDIFLTRSDALIGVESKFLEHLSTKRPKIADAYFSIADHRTKSKWFNFMDKIKEETVSFLYLDVAQLIKHFFGLCFANDQAKKTLLYIYWEPDNWSKSKALCTHRQELESFSDLVEDDSLLSFKYQSYAQLWDQWKGESVSFDMLRHCANLEERYQITL